MITCINFSKSEAIKRVPDFLSAFRLEKVQLKKGQWKQLKSTGRLFGDRLHVLERDITNDHKKSVEPDSILVKLLERIGFIHAPIRKVSLPLLNQHGLGYNEQEVLSDSLLILTHDGILAKNKDRDEVLQMVRHREKKIFTKKCREKIELIVYGSLGGGIVGGSLHGLIRWFS